MPNVSGLTRIVIDLLGGILGHFWGVWSKGVWIGYFTPNVLQNKKQSAGDTVTSGKSLYTQQ